MLAYEEDRFCLSLEELPAVTIENSSIDFNVLPLTASIHFKTSVAGGGCRGLLNKYSSMSMNGWSIMTYSGVLRIYYFGGSERSKIQWESSQIQVCDDQWHHVAMTISDKKEVGMCLYIDGELKETTPWTGIPRKCSNDYQSVQIGAYDFAFDGLLREAAVWHACLDAKEVKLLSQHTPPQHVCSAKLLGAWPCDEGQGNVLHDLANSHPGKIHGRAQWRAV